MAYVFTALNSTWFILDSNTTGASELLDLSDNLINTNEALFWIDNEPLDQDVELLAGGLGSSRVVQVFGDDGNDTVMAGNAVLSALHLFMGTGSDLLQGGRNADLIFAGDGNNTIQGFDGTDSIVSGTGSDTVDGGNGNDTVAAGDGENTVYGGAGDDEIYTGAGNDSVYGGTGNDYIETDGANDTVLGGDGEDTVWAGSGADSVFGGNGADDIFAGSDNDTVEGGKGADFIRGWFGDDLIRGGDGNDDIRGNDGNDTIYGNGQNDEIDGDDGDDVLDGGKGNDTIEADDGNDTVYDGTGKDRIDLTDDVAVGKAGNTTDVADNDFVNNAHDGQRDVFYWTEIYAPSLLGGFGVAGEQATEWDTIAFFDATGAVNNDQIDLSQIAFPIVGNNLVAEVFGGLNNENGLIVVYASELHRIAERPSLVVEWLDGTGGAINVSAGSGADIKVSLGWDVYDGYTGDTIF